MDKCFICDKEIQRDSIPRIKPKINKIMLNENEEEHPVCDACGNLLSIAFRMYEGNLKVKKRRKRMKANDISKVLVLIFALLFMASWLTFLIKKGLNTKSRYEIIEEKIDRIASQTDVITEKVDNLESDFAEYRQNNKDVIDMLIDNINNYKDEMQKEIESIYQDIEAVEIAKAEAKKQRQTTYAPTVTYASTDGLTASAGVNNYEGHRETYYNLNMSRVVSNAQNSGIDGEYWVRDDGAKMYGDYVIVAANQELYPYGSTVETSLGTGIVLDTGTFINTYPEGYDLATDW